MANQKYEAFVKVAETGSFKEAAGELGYTQAGVSYLVGALEKELGMPLLVRDYGGAHPTADGKTGGGSYRPCAAYLASAASLAAAHQDSLARYHATVSARPAAKSVRSGRQPSSRRIFEGSMA